MDFKFFFYFVKEFRKLFLVFSSYKTADIDFYV